MSAFFTWFYCIFLPRVNALLPFTQLPPTECQQKICRVIWRILSRRAHARHLTSGRPVSCVGGQLKDKILHASDSEGTPPLVPIH